MDRSSTMNRPTSSRFTLQGQRLPQQRPPQPQESETASSSNAPWGSPSLGTFDQMFNLRPYLNQGDLAETLFNRLESPSDFLTRPPQYSAALRDPQLPSSHSRTQNYQQPSADPWDDLSDPFQEFEYHSPTPPGSQRHDTSADIQAAPGFVDLSEASTPCPMAYGSRKRRASEDFAAQNNHKRPKAGTASKISPPATAQMYKTKVEAVDLSAIDDDVSYAEYKRKQDADAIRQQQQDEADKPQKLARFQCIICLDQPTDLTITHCGHMFCSYCLHEALHAATSKKVCPVCRQPISIPKQGQKHPQKSFWPLTMKLMTAKRKGKMAQ